MRDEDVIPPGGSRGPRTPPPPDGLPDPAWREFAARREGMIFAMDGGLWLHRHVWKGRRMAHLVSTNRDHLLAYGRRVGLDAARLQYKPLKDPRTGERRPAWHWDLIGAWVPERNEDRETKNEESATRRSSFGRGVP